MQSPELAIQELKRCMTIGLAGVEVSDDVCRHRIVNLVSRQLQCAAGPQIGSHVNDMSLADPELFPIFKAAAEIGAAIFVHPWDMTSNKLMSKYWMPWCVLRTHIAECIAEAIWRIAAGWSACQRRRAWLFAACCLVVCWSGCQTSVCCLRMAVGPLLQLWVGLITDTKSGRTCVQVRVVECVSCFAAFSCLNRMGLLKHSGHHKKPKGSAWLLLHGFSGS
jgi:hypothetical protein